MRGRLSCLVANAVDGGTHTHASLFFVLGFCFAQTALRAELPEGVDLVLAHFDNCLDETPYCVVVDHTWQSIVITIRGTHSFEVSTCNCDAEVFPK